MALSVQLDSLNVGGHLLNFQKMTPAHRRLAESSLSSFFSKRQVVIGEDKTPFRFQIDPQTATLRLQDRSISLEMAPELAGLHRVVRFYQNTGLLPLPGVSREEKAHSEGKTKEAVSTLRAASVPGAYGNLFAGMRLMEDSLSITRNILFAIPSVGPDNALVNHLGYYAGGFWTFFSLKELGAGVKEYQRAKAIGDGEGRRRAAGQVASAGLASTASMIYLAGRTFDTAAASTAALHALGTANILFGVGSLLAAGTSALGAYRCYRFNDRLNEYLDNTHLTEEERLRGALQFLKDQIAVTPEEKGAIWVQINQEHPTWTQKEKEALLEQRLRDRTEVKVKYLKRRTSNKSLQLIITHADRYLADLSNPATRIEATQMLQTVQKETKIKMALFILGVIAALIGFAAMVALTFFSMGTLPFILYGVAGAIYLALAAYSIAVTLSRKETEGKVDLHPMQDIGPHAFGSILS